MKQWLYSLFFSDFIRKAIALVLAIVLYFVLHGVSDEQYYEIKNIDDVPVILNLHDDLLDTSNKHYTISVEVKGSKEALKNLSAKDLELVVDVSDQNLQKNSTYYVALSASKLYKNLDVSGVNVTKIKDKGLLLYLQKKVTVSKKIEVKYEGSLRDNLAISDVAIDPPEIEVTGPKNIVDNIASVKTEAVPLSTDITDYFEAGHTKEDFEGLLDKTVTKKGMELDTKDENIADLLAFKIDTSGNRKIIQAVRNFEIVLQKDPRFAGKIKFDEFSQQVYLMGDVPWQTGSNYRAWSSHDDSQLFSIIQSEYGLTSRNDFYDALKNVSIQNKFHPIRDILEGLKWDGKEHIRGLLPNFLGADDSEYNYEVMKLFLLGAVARIFQPGCKFDYCMILQGPQGVGKSTFLRFLALDDRWFSDSLDSLDESKAAQLLIGSWIIEMAELKSLVRTGGGMASVKRFLSATSDKLRLPYERRADVFLRQAVFSGTTNEISFLSDETGNRRFLIVYTGNNKPKKNLFEPSAMEEIKQAWAEAVHIYKTENPKLLLPEYCIKEAEELQKESLTDDGKTGLIEKFLEDKTMTCAIEIWNECLNESGRPQKWQAIEINNIVSNFEGWEKMKTPYKFTKYGSQRGFRKRENVVKNQQVTFDDLGDLENVETPFD